MTKAPDDKPKYIIPQTGYFAHDPDRPQPPIVTPGVAQSAPSDATVLFDGKDLSAWRGSKQDEPTWKVEDGYMEVVPKTGGIVTREEFGDIQLHLEFASPAEVQGQGQGRGNSGVFMMGTYEIQVLDNFENPTYPDGTVGAIYSQWPPLVNGIRKPGEWNTYDVLWEVPLFEGPKLLKPAFITVLFNGIVIHNHTQILGPTVIGTGDLPCYKAHPPVGPISLQDHGNPVRFRNIWVRRIGAYDLV
ncbi:MAG: DUF1080 domain-containing protein [Kiritimatiellae bacterium]|nr:DUF1080 domain-containing protein [Kiritimatiellia bacterium]